MRVVFLGSPRDAVAPLRALHDAGHDIALVVTQPDRRRGRGSELVASPVKQAALELNLPVVTPERSREIIEQVADLHADLGVVVAFGQLLPQTLLDALPGGFVNVHFSLLPRWRGAAPVERAILAGDVETGVCLMQLEAGLDTGPVYACARTAITDDDTAATLRARLTDLGTELLVRELVNVPGSSPVAQEGEATYAAKLAVDEFELDWKQSAEQLARVVRAGNPKPGAWTTVAGRRLKVLRAHADPIAADQQAAEPGTVVGSAVVATSAGVLHLDDVQPEGKAVMAGHAWMSGARGVERLGR
jgi:methionyl-tRNA formyltransferase